MKNRIEVAANLIVIVLAVVVGSVYLRDRLAMRGLEGKEIKAGDRLPRLEGWEWGAHDRTLVLALRKGCHFCEDSAPFYQRLAATQQEDRSNIAIVAVFPDPVDAVNEVVRSEALGVRALPEVPLERLKISGTPSLMLVDRSGMVLNIWIGMLSPRQELEVMRAVACPDNSCHERT